MERPEARAGVDEQSQESKKSEKLELASKIAGIAMEAAELPQKLRAKFLDGTLTEQDINLISVDIERYIYRNVCDALEIDADTRRSGLRE